jgi:biotin carboxyl carrier protein
MKIVLRAGEEDHLAEISGEGDRLTILLDGKPRTVDVLQGDQGSLSLLIDGRAYACDFETRKGGQVRVHIRESVFELEVLDERRARRQLVSGGLGASGPQVILAPMPGKIVRLLAKVGQAVKAGEGLIVIEAMKMENELRSPKAGRVKDVSVTPGTSVEAGRVLVVIE